MCIYIYIICLHVMFLRSLQRFSLASTRQGDKLSGTTKVSTLQHSGMGKKVGERNANSAKKDKKDIERHLRKLRKVRFLMFLSVLSSATA